MERDSTKNLGSSLIFFVNHPTARTITVFVNKDIGHGNMLSLLNELAILRSSLAASSSRVMRSSSSSSRAIGNFRCLGSSPKWNLRQPHLRLGKRGRFQRHSDCGFLFLLRWMWTNNDGFDR